MARYGVGIIGAGWVAGEYVKIFSNHPQTELVGVYNRTPGKAMALLESLGVEAREYASLDELFDDERIQIIASCTHPDTRREHCVRAAETGRHIVIEKPVGVTLDDSLAIRDAVARAGVKSVTSFVLRWNPQLVTVKRLIADGVLGDLLYGEADYWHPLQDVYPGYRSFVSKAQGVSAFVCGGCHAVDTLRYLAGRQDVNEQVRVLVDAIWSRTTSDEQRRLRYGGSDGWPGVEHLIVPLIPLLRGHSPDH